MEAKELCEAIKNFCRNRECAYCSFHRYDDNGICCFNDSTAQLPPVDWEMKVQDIVIFD